MIDLQRRIRAASAGVVAAAHHLEDAQVLEDEAYTQKTSLSEQFQRLAEDVHRDRGQILRGVAHSYE